MALAGSAYATAIAVGIFNAAAAQPPTATERQVLIRERAAGGRSQQLVEIRLLCTILSVSFPYLISCLSHRKWRQIYMYAAHPLLVVLQYKTAFMAAGMYGIVAYSLATVIS